MARALADPVRWQLVQVLARRTRSVGELVERVGVTQPLVSHHLRVLREAGVVEGERVQYRTYYRIRPRVLRALADRLARTADRAPDPPTPGRRAGP